MCGWNARHLLRNRANQQSAEHIPISHFHSQERGRGPGEEDHVWLPRQVPQTAGLRDVIGRGEGAEADSSGEEEVPRSQQEHVPAGQRGHGGEEEQVHGDELLPPPGPPQVPSQVPYQVPHQVQPAVR